jgi:hypothetical protein
MNQSHHLSIRLQARNADPKGFLAHSRPSELDSIRSPARAASVSDPGPPADSKYHPGEVAGDHRNVTPVLRLCVCDKNLPVRLVRVSLSRPGIRKPITLNQQPRAAGAGTEAAAYKSLSECISYTPIQFLFGIFMNRRCVYHVLEFKYQRMVGHFSFRE